MFKILIPFLRKHYLIIISLFITLLYLSFPILITYDGAHYLGYVEIFKGNIPFENWNIVRGPTLPFITYIATSVFGENGFGLVLMTYPFYILMLFISKKILDYFGERSSNTKYLLYVLFGILVILNPIIFGYYHALLTEFVAITLSLLSCYLSWVFLKTEYGESKKMFLFISLYFFFSVPFSWFLKQPYISTTLFPLILSVLLQNVYKKDCRILVSKVIVVILSLLSLFVSICAWNSILSRYDVNTQSSNNNSHMLGSLLLDGLHTFEILEDYEAEQVPTEKGIYPKEGIKLVEVRDMDGKILEYVELKVDSKGYISANSGLNFLSQALIRHPYLVMKTYISNYLGIVNVLKVEREGLFDDYVTSQFQILGCQENCIVGINIVNGRNNIYNLPEQMYEVAEDYKQVIHTPSVFRILLSSFIFSSLLSFNWLLLLLPVLLAYCLGIIIFRREQLPTKQLSLLYLVFILLSYSFFNILAHAIGGSIIDRYASPSYITAILGSMGLSVYYLNKRMLH